MTGEYDEEVTPQQAARNPYITERLIVKSSDRNLDPEEYGAVDAIQSRDGTYILQFDSSAEARKAEKELSKEDKTKYVEPDIVLFAAEEDSGSVYAGADGDLSAGMEAQLSPAGTDSVSSAADSSSLWNIETTGTARYAGYIREEGYNKKKVIAVLDTGISFTHELLKGRLLTSKAVSYVSGCDVDETKQSSPVGHGTHVAGIIAQCTSGLDVSILPIRVLGENQVGSLSGVIDGINYAVQQGADVINLSLAGAAEDRSLILESCIQAAVNQGTIVVVSAGNGILQGSSYVAADITSHYITPAYISDCIVVGSVNSSRTRAENSNFGETLDVVAPGVAIWSSYIDSFGYNTYAYLSGTSMAAPHVAAQAAMLEMVYSSYSAKNIEKLIQAQAVDLGAAGKDPYFGYGFASFEKLLNTLKRTVTYDPGAYGTFSKKTYTVQYGSATPSAPAVTGEEGYLFTGWSPQVSAKVTKNVTYVAQWERIKYTVSFEPGSYGAFTRQVYTVPYGDATPSAPSVTGRAGYSFTGWSPQVSLTVTKSMTYVAQWEKIKYTISFEPGAYGTFARQVSTVSYGDATPSAPVVTGRTGYSFIGWSPQISSVVSGNASYVAQWGKVKYTVTYKPGKYGTFAEQSSTVLYGNATPPAPVVTGKAGYAFTGWSEKVAPTVSRNVVYTAQWKKSTDPHANITYVVSLKKKQKTDVLKVLGLGGGDSVVTWKSSDSKKASVKGKADGTCVVKAGSRTGDVKILATTASGSKVTFRIKVQKNKVVTKKILVPSKKVSVTVGKKKQLAVELYPVTSTDKISYTSSNKEVVTVSKNGVLKGKAKGTAVVTIQSGSKTMKVKVTVGA